MTDVSENINRAIERREAEQNINRAVTGYGVNRAVQTYTTQKVGKKIEKAVGKYSPTPKPDSGTSFFSAAMGRLSARSHEIAHEMQESPEYERREHAKRRKGSKRKSYPAEPYEPLMSGPAFRDPFGVSGYGMGFGSAPEPMAPPRRRKKKRGTTRAPSRSPPMARGGQFLDPFHIPRHMRHMF